MLNEWAESIRDWPLLISGVLLVVPFLLGLAIGSAGRNLRLPTWAVGAMLALMPLLGLTANWIPFGFWNLAFFGLDVALGGFLGLGGATTPVVLAMAGLFAVSLGAVEVMARLFLPPLARATLPSNPVLFVTTRRTALAAGEIPRLWPVPPGDTADQDSRKLPSVWHLGDSMVRGSDLPPGGKATDELKPLLPGFNEVNIGMPGTGPDIQYYVLLQWLKSARQPPVLVVHHLFPGNDLEDMDQDFHFCNGSGILEYLPSKPVPCRHPQWQFSIYDLLMEATPPYLVLATERYSVAAANAANSFLMLHARMDAWKGRARIVDDPHPPDYERRWEHIEQIMAAERDDLRSRGIPLIVAVFPYRQSLESADPERTEASTVRRRMLDIVQRLGIQTIDAWPAFEDAVRRDGAARYFLPPQDIHFTLAGHQLYARLLADEMRSKLPQTK
jgi:hypothetical protein